jgi:DNA modification methylase
MDNLIKKVTEISYDKESIAQESLNLANKFRAGLFPWRGQFSPELIEIFLDKYSQDTSIVLDPFVGSGTTLFEALRKGLTCYGAEINPSAIEMSRTAQLANLSLTDRKAVIREAIALTEKLFRPSTWDLFSYQEEYSPQRVRVADDELLKALVQETKNDALIQNFITNALIRYMNYCSPRARKDFFRALQEHARIVESIPYSDKACKVFHSDARSIPLADKSVDLIITSPPYINVFNYHQNNRPAMELIGWDLLDIAKSEIGSNRKHRQNRFLTVIQYALDMLDVLQEMYRLLRPHGRAIIVVGRESHIRGASFRNGLLVAVLAIGGAKFQLETRQERMFVNKFGETIYEDILHLVPGSDPIITGDTLARSVAIWSLDQAYKNVEPQVGLEILEAKKRAATVRRSPLFSTSTLAHPEMRLQPPEKNLL